MAEGLNVRLTHKLQAFIESRIGPESLYGSASEYIRDLVRRDYEQEESRKWARLTGRLRKGMEAREDSFTPFDPDEIIKQARQEKRSK